MYINKKKTVTKNNYYIIKGYSIYIPTYILYFYEY